MAYKINFIDQTTAEVIEDILPSISEVKRAIEDIYDVQWQCPVTITNMDTLKSVVIETYDFYDILKQIEQEVSL